MIPASLNPMMMSGSEPLLLDDYPATAAWSSARKLKSTSTRPFVFGAANVTGLSTLPAITSDAIYTSSGEVDISDITTKIGSYNQAGITSWDDQTGNGYVANRTAGTGLAGYPTFYSTVSGGFVYLNGKLAPYYIATFQRYLSFPSITLGGEYVVFMVVQAGNNTSQLGGSSSGNGGTNAAIRCGTASHIAADSSGYDITATGTTNPSLLRATKLSGNRDIYIDGVNKSTTTTTSTRNGTLDQIGRVLSAASYLYHEGRIVEIIIYNRALTLDEINSIEQNLAAFYGITLP